MTLRLLPLPEKMETLLFSFDSFSDAGAFAGAILGTKLLAAVEVANKTAIEKMDFRGSMDFSPGLYVVMVALEAFDEAVARMQKELLVMAQHFKAKGTLLCRKTSTGSSGLAWASCRAQPFSVSRVSWAFNSTILCRPGRRCSNLRIRLCRKLTWITRCSVMRETA